MRFYGRFAAAWGTVWLVLFAIAFLSRSHINLGEGGMILCLLGSLVYAAVRAISDRTSSIQQQTLLQENAALRAALTQQHAAAYGPPAQPGAVPPAYVHQWQAPR
jgi:hypothetical protein